MTSDRSVTTILLNLTCIGEGSKRMNHPVASVHRALFVVCLTSLPSLAFAQATTQQTETDATGNAEVPVVSQPTEAAPAQPAEVAPQPPPATPGGPTAAAPAVTPEAVTPAPAPPAEAAPAKTPELPKVNIGVWLRSALRF